MFEPIDSGAGNWDREVQKKLRECSDVYFKSLSTCAVPCRKKLTETFNSPLHHLRISSILSRLLLPRSWSLKYFRRSYWSILSSSSLRVRLPDAIVRTKLSFCSSSCGFSFLTTIPRSCASSPTYGTELCSLILFHLPLKYTIRQLVTLLLNGEVT